MCNYHMLQRITYLSIEICYFNVKIHFTIIENTHTIISHILRKCLVVRGCFYIKTNECSKVFPSVDDAPTPSGYRRLRHVSSLNTVDSTEISVLLNHSMSPEPFYLSTFTGCHRLDTLSWKMPIEFLT